MESVHSKVCRGSGEPRDRVDTGNAEMVAGGQLEG